MALHSSETPEARFTRVYEEHLDELKRLMLRGAGKQAFLGAKE